MAQCTRFRESKTYLGALLKVLLTLPLTSQDSTAIKRLRALVGKCREAGFASELPQEAPVLIAKGRSRIGRKGAKKSFPLLNMVSSSLCFETLPNTKEHVCSTILLVIDQKTGNPVVSVQRSRLVEDVKPVPPHLCLADVVTTIMTLLPRKKNEVSCNVCLRWLMVTAQDTFGAMKHRESFCVKVTTCDCHWCTCLAMFEV